MHFALLFLLQNEMCLATQQLSKQLLAYEKQVTERRYIAQCCAREPRWPLLKAPSEGSPCPPCSLPFPLSLFYFFLTDKI